jgi:hypothetical protein
VLRVRVFEERDRLPRISSIGEAVVLKNASVSPVKLANVIIVKVLPQITNDGYGVWAILKSDRPLAVVRVIPLEVITSTAPSSAVLTEKSNLINAAHIPSIQNLDSVLTNEEQEYIIKMYSVLSVLFETNHELDVQNSSVNISNRNNKNVQIQTKMLQTNAPEPHKSVRTRPSTKQTDPDFKFSLIHDVVENNYYDIVVEVVLNLPDQGKTLLWVTDYTVNKSLKYRTPSTEQNHPGMNTEYTDSGRLFCGPYGSRVLEVTVWEPHYQVANGADFQRGSFVSLKNVRVYRKAMSPILEAGLHKDQTYESKINLRTVQSEADIKHVEELKKRKKLYEYYAQEGCYSETEYNRKHTAKVKQKSNKRESKRRKREAEAREKAKRNEAKRTNQNGILYEMPLDSYVSNH